VTLTTALTSAQLPDPALVDAIAFAPASQRYSFVFDGNAQELDHVLVTPDLRVNRVEYGRMDADFPESYRGDFTRPERVSDHDPLVVFFNTPDIDTTSPALTLPADITIEGNATGGALVFYAATAFDAVDGPVTPVCAPPSGALFPVGATTVTCTATDRHGNFSTGSFTVTVTDTKPPTVTSARATPSELWPVNKSLIPVTVLVNAIDIVSGTESRITGITGNDGATAADWTITGPLSAALRAERTGGGRGRTYTIAIETRDAAGNTTTSTVDVFVPHDQRGRK
jgi:HYR domain-containing protein